MSQHPSTVLRALGIFAIWLSFAGWVVSAVLLMGSNEPPNDIGVLVYQATGGILFLGPLGLILSLPGMVGSAYAVTHAGMESTIPSIAVSAAIFGVWFGLLGIFIGTTTGPN